MADGDYRARENSIRIRIAKSGSGLVKYVSLIVTTCAPSTFQCWGKKIEAPIIDIDGNRYLVTLDPINAP